MDNESLAQQIKSTGNLLKELGVQPILLKSGEEASQGDPNKKPDRLGKLILSNLQRPDENVTMESTLELQKRAFVRHGELTEDNSEIGYVNNIALQYNTLTGEYRLKPKPTTKIVIKNVPEIYEKIHNGEIDDIFEEVINEKIEEKLAKIRDFSKAEKKNDAKIQLRNCIIYVIEKHLTLEQKKFLFFIRNYSKNSVSMEPCCCEFKFCKSQTQSDILMCLETDIKYEKLYTRDYVSEYKNEGYFDLNITNVANANCTNVLFEAISNAFYNYITYDNAVNLVKTIIQYCQNLLEDIEKWFYVKNEEIRYENLKFKFDSSETYNVFEDARITLLKEIGRFCNYIDEFKGRKINIICERKLVDVKNNVYVDNMTVVEESWDKYKVGKTLSPLYKEEAMAINYHKVISIVATK